MVAWALLQQEMLMVASTFAFSPDPRGDARNRLTIPLLARPVLSLLWRPRTDVMS